MNHTFMKKNPFIRFLAACLFSIAIFTPTLAQAQSLAFADVSRTHPDYVAITYLRDTGVINGYDNNTYRPSNLINKAEVVKVIVENIDTAPEVGFEPSFPDVTEDLWYAEYVMSAQAMDIVSGNGIDGAFEGSKPVNLAEFLKMILIANGVDAEAFKGANIVSNLSGDEWFSGYLNYAASIGIVQLDGAGEVDPGKSLNRADVAEIIYLLTISQKGEETQFLIDRATAEMAQIEVYVAANQLKYAKNAASLAVDMTQQAYKNMPTDNVVLGAAKIARAYDWLVDAYILGAQGDNKAAESKANDVIEKATEAWEVDNGTQAIAAHIKERAREILKQVQG